MKGNEASGPLTLVKKAVLATTTMTVFASVATGCSQSVEQPTCTEALSEWVTHTDTLAVTDTAESAPATQRLLDLRDADCVFAGDPGSETSVFLTSSSDEADRITASARTDLENGAFSLVSETASGDPSATTFMSDTEDRALASIVSYRAPISTWNLPEDTNVVIISVVTLAPNS
ncbi:hypothetical protein [Microbacterium marmarense]|uniref:DUF4232 domain-containing protein n=1 Tax=Microbacterium marmarense TaxID=3122051 RepID=A0ABU8LQZ8_9MICO